MISPSLEYMALRPSGPETDESPRGGGPQRTFSATEALRLRSLSVNDLPRRFILLKRKNRIDRLGRTVTVIDWPSEKPLALPLRHLKRFRARGRARRLVGRS